MIKREDIHNKFKFETHVSNTYVLKAHIEYSNIERTYWTLKYGTFILNTQIWNIHAEYSNIEH